MECSMINKPIDIRELEPEKLQKILALTQQFLQREIHIGNELINHLLTEHENWSEQIVKSLSVRRSNLFECFNSDVLDVVNGIDAPLN